MQVLLDTHTFLWWVDGGTRLSRRARAAIRRPDHVCKVSLASAWEMSIKVSLGKLQLPTAAARFFSEQLAANHFDALGIDLRHIDMVSTLPFHHRDPFDRLLVAQALTEDLTIVSADPVFARYGVRRIW